MIQIKQRGPDFIVKFSDPGTDFQGYTVKAHSISEVKRALDHYYGQGAHAVAHLHDCPLCREIDKERKVNIA